MSRVHVQNDNVSAMGFNRGLRGCSNSVQKYNTIYYPKKVQHNMLSKKSTTKFWRIFYEKILNKLIFHDLYKRNYWFLL